MAFNNTRFFREIPWFIGRFAHEKLCGVSGRHRSGIARAYDSYFIGSTVVNVVNREELSLAGSVGNRPSRWSWVLALVESRSRQTSFVESARKGRSKRFSRVPWQRGQSSEGRIHECVGSSGKPWSSSGSFDPRERLQARWIVLPRVILQIGEYIRPIYGSLSLSLEWQFVSDVPIDRDRKCVFSSSRSTMCVT